MSNYDRILTDSDTQVVHVAAMDVHDVGTTVRAHIERGDTHPDIIRAEVALRAAHDALMEALRHVDTAVSHADQ